MANATNSYYPVLPIKNSVIYPGTVLPLRIGRPRSMAAVQRADGAEQWLVTVAQSKIDDNREPVAADLYLVGTLCKIERLRGSSEDGYQAVVRGVSRFAITSLREDGGYLEAKGEVLADKDDLDAKTAQVLLGSVKTLAGEMLKLLPADTERLSEMLESVDDLGYLSHLCAANIEVGLPLKQELLELVSLKGRVLRLLELMQTSKDSLLVQSEIRDKLSHKLGKVQRESILREQLRTIREELGEGNGPSGDDDYRKRIEDADMPEAVKKTALEELKRLETVGNSSPEAHVIRNYLDLLVGLPWGKSSGSEIDLEKAREILDHDHYGLPKIKKRIVQHLGVMKLKKNAGGSILLLVGPPGVGKTSLGQSIARALGRKFVRGSLGGVRDDAEIRGHRRTYIGAMPGRIIQGIKRAGENNPVFILDEIDKMANSYHSDPAAALLEVLDPEQNSGFLDHYLDVPFDLSKVFFIATANTLESIPGPLLDRMEVIDVSGYTTAEKLHIAKNHLIPKQLEAHGLTANQLVLGDEALMRIITHYTREAGVRELQRHIATVCRASSELVLNASQLPIRIELAGLEEILGNERYAHEVAERVSPPGVVTGLAWTPQGGEILFIEASLMPGSGKLTLTGQLGDVMKESAQIALSVVRSKMPAIVPGFEYDKRDLHIHVPAGAIPKDGPSAGITMLTTIASLFSGRSVDPKLAMTGEVTLRGAVMPVGGIKEKVMAAHRAGIERIIMSKRNQKDLKDVPDEVRSQLKFDFVENVTEALKLALNLDVVAPVGLELPVQNPPVVLNG
ncbi:MAG: endopeptidase La [Deltaproteobacteria bacterium]|nr:endopeptidase La [Deltaproteobacteria bacterium]